MLKGKTAVITGGSRGIGKAIVLKMASEGANVAIVYAGNDEAAAETRKLAAACGVKAEAYKCDVSDFEAVKDLTGQIITDFQTVDILVNNAGVVRDSLIMAMRQEDFDTVLNINLKGSFNTIRHLSPIMIKKRSGRIINISSVSGIMGNAGQANYSAAKAGMIGLTKTVAKELAGRKITVNAIAPGFIQTDMTAALNEKVKDAALSQIPMKRIGDPEDIANLAVYLASDAAGYITGEIIKVDGGLYI
jgi:3-oxoacyl-[acyl-carrier protein] reductase